MKPVTRTTYRLQTIRRPSATGLHFDCISTAYRLQRVCVLTTDRPHPDRMWATGLTWTVRWRPMPCPRQEGLSNPSRGSRETLHEVAP